MRLADILADIAKAGRCLAADFRIGVAQQQQQIVDAVVVTDVSERLDRTHTYVFLSVRYKGIILADLPFLGIGFRFFLNLSPKIIRQSPLIRHGYARQRQQVLLYALL
jgi:hypothetical protein